MLPVTDAEKALINDLTTFRKNALEALDKISDGFKLATLVSNNTDDENIRNIATALTNVNQLLSDFQISQDSDTLWIRCKVDQKTLYYRDAAGTPINAKSFMFALMSFENALSRNIDVIHNISKSYISTLYHMKEVLHTHISNYVESK